MDNEMEAEDEMVLGEAERWDVSLEDEGQLVVEGSGVEGQEVVGPVSKVEDRCWSSRQSSRGRHGGNQGLEPQPTNSGCQGGSVGSRTGEVEVCTGRRWGGEVGDVAGLGLGADAEEVEQEGLSVSGDTVVLEDAEQAPLLGEYVGLAEA